MRPKLRITAAERKKLKKLTVRASALKNRNRARIYALRGGRIKREKQEWKDYQREYQKNYLLDPKNRFCHSIRTNFRSWLKRKENLKTTKKTRITYAITRKKYNRILNSLAKSIGYKSFEHEDLTIDHLVTIRFFYEFGCKSPLIICDPLNVTVIKREDNSSKRSFATDAAIIAANKLELKYKDQLNGFTDFIIKKRFEQEVLKEEEEKKLLEYCEAEIQRIKNKGRGKVA